MTLLAQTPTAIAHLVHATAPGMIAHWAAPLYAAVALFALSRLGRLDGEEGAAQDEARGRALPTWSEPRAGRPGPLRQT